MTKLARQARALGVSLAVRSTGWDRHAAREWAGYAARPKAAPRAAFCTVSMRMQHALALPWIGPLSTRCSKMLNANKKRRRGAS